MKVLEGNNEDLERTKEAIRLVARYHIDPRKEGHEAIGRDELAADIASLQKQIENPPSLGSMIFGTRPPWWQRQRSKRTSWRVSASRMTRFPSQQGSCFRLERARRGHDSTNSKTHSTNRVPTAARHGSSPCCFARCRATSRRGRRRGRIDDLERAFRASVNLARAVAYEVRLPLPVVWIMSGRRRVWREGSVITIWDGE